MNNLQHITTASQYRKKYLHLLKQPMITKQELREFNEAVKHYKIVFPDDCWREFNIN